MSDYLINPLTMRPIKRGSRVYKKLVKNGVIIETVITHTPIKDKQKKLLIAKKEKEIEKEDKIEIEDEKEQEVI